MVAQISLLLLDTKITTRSKDGDKKWSGKTSGMEGSVEEAEERRRKRLERFNAEKLGTMEERWCM